MEYVRGKRSWQKNYTYHGKGKYLKLAFIL